jgi:asparagine synthase (glutamine-hydrolysing)
MCGISGILRLDHGSVDALERRLAVMNDLLAHRGPDDSGTWCDAGDGVGLGHRRLTIIDLTDSGHQPMTSPSGAVLSFNGEIYNYLELKRRYQGDYSFNTHSDTETILAAYDARGVDCVEDLRGMFSFAIWDPKRHRLLCARDRFGIKPFYYAVVDGVLYFASEMKALLPFLPSVDTDADALAEYLTFQFTLGENTLFSGVKQLLPGHRLIVENGNVKVERYWDVRYEVDWDHSPAYFHRRLRELLDDSIQVHLRSDVPVGSYLSGGIDSSLIAMLATEHDERNQEAFHGKFTCHPGYDESPFAVEVAAEANKHLHQVDITSQDFLDSIEDVIYHLDTPVAGPGSFPQYMVSALAAKHVKVVLGGQGGDEIFGGYARYLVAYFEQCMKAAIDGTHHNGNFVVTPESIIPNLGLLREYKPLIKSFFSKGLFESIDQRYFRLVDRSGDMADEVRWDLLDRDAVWGSFESIFNSRRNVQHEAYFDSMTHFDFKTLLPALLQVEDRMSMAHGLESRVPMLDHSLVEFAATIPADVKFKDGQMKFMLKQAYGDVLPKSLLERRDKMGFPVPLGEWYQSELSEFVNDVFRSDAARTRPLMNSDAVLANFDGDAKFSRKTWGLLSLELWQRRFHDQSGEFRKLIDSDKYSNTESATV